MPTTSVGTSDQSWSPAQNEHDFNQQLKFFRQRLCESPWEVDVMTPFIYGVYDIMRQENKQLYIAEPKAVLHAITDLTSQKLQLFEVPKENRLSEVVSDEEPTRAEQVKHGILDISDSERQILHRVFGRLSGIYFS